MEKELRGLEEGPETEKYLDPKQHSNTTELENARLWWHTWIQV